MSDTNFNKQTAENVLIGAFFQYSLYKNKFIKSSSFVSSEDISSLRRKITFYIKTAISKKLKGSEIENFINWLKIDRNSVLVSFNSSCSFNRYFDPIATYCSILLKKMNVNYFSSKFIDFSFERNNSLRINLNERFIKDKKPYANDENGRPIKTETILLEKANIVFYEISIIVDKLIELFNALHSVDTLIYRNKNYNWSAEELDTMIQGIKGLNSRYDNPQARWALEPLLRITEACNQLVKLKDDFGADISNIRYDSGEDRAENFIQLLFECWTNRRSECDEYMNELINCAQWAVDSLNQVRADLGINS